MNTLKTTVATIGLIAGLCTAAQPIPRAHAESARREVCEQWLSVVNNERYDAAMRQYAAQTIRDCGFAVSYGGPVWTPSYAPTPPLAPVVAVPSAQGGGREVALTNTRSGHFVDATVNERMCASCSIPAPRSRQSRWMRPWLLPDWVGCPRMICAGQSRSNWQTAL